ncbi:hypothetical protein AAEH90_20975, partial [Shewanella algae]|uniref:hypothetical protein n=1 Tax=Shewanella algae TaxID=38313 RepID=UPI00313E8C90
SVLTGDFWVSGKDTFIYLTKGIISTPKTAAERQRRPDRLRAMLVLFVKLLFVMFYRLLSQ